MGKKKESAKSPDQKVRDFLDEAMKRLKKGFEADSHNRRESLEDIDFLNGEQWDAAEKKRRKTAGRPALVINHLNKYVDQIVGDMRQNRARVKVRPVDSKSDINLAKIRGGLIANIEYQSSAESIYDEAGTSMVECGYGAWRVLTRYTEENPFLQEAYLEIIPNPFVVVMDPDAKDFMYADANWGFILDRMPEDEFRKEYPGADVPPESLGSDEGLGYEHWYSDKNVTIAEYFVREKKKTPMCQMQDGQVLTEEDAADLKQDWLNRFGPILAVNPEAEVPPEPVIVNTRDAEVYKIRHYKITASEILSENDIDGEVFPGKYIPIILVRGKKRNKEGKTFIRGLVREAKDPQRIINYWESAGAEVVALAPKAPWIGTPKQFEGFENDYASANIENYPFLKYNPDPDAQNTPPRRVGMGEVPVAIFTQIQRANENLKSVIGMFNRDVGDTGPEVTGRAILAAQKPGETATYAYPDNLSKAIAHSGKIINEIIPEIYDTERDIRVRQFDDSETFVPINTTAKSALSLIEANPERYQGMDVTALRKALKKGGDATFNDMTAGKYDVVITVGPSYSTQRQEAAQNLLTLVNAAPRIMEVAGDLVVSNLDFKDADELSSRLRKTLPPGLAKPREGDEPEKPLPPTPQQQLEMSKLEFQKAKTEAEKERLKIQQVKLLKESQETKGNIRKEILSALQELFGKDHPADHVIDGMKGQHIEM